MNLFFSRSFVPDLKRSREKRASRISFVNDWKALFFCAQWPYVLLILRFILIHDIIFFHLWGMGFFLFFASDEQAIGKCGFIGIARTKSMFTLATMNDNRYKDIKVNAIFHSQKMNKSVICEIQLILQSYLTIKKDGHRLYEIVRRQNLVEHVHQNVQHDFANEQLYLAARSGLDCCTL